MEWLIINEINHPSNVSIIIFSNLTIWPFGLCAPSLPFTFQSFHQTVLLKAAKWERSFSSLIVVRFVTEWQPRESRKLLRCVSMLNLINSRVTLYKFKASITLCREDLWWICVVKVALHVQTEDCWCLCMYPEAAMHLKENHTSSSICKCICIHLTIKCNCWHNSSSEQFKGTFVYRTVSNLKLLRVRICA